jgi:transposase-like protein
MTEDPSAFRRRNWIAKLRAKHSANETLSGVDLLAAASEIERLTKEVRRLERELSAERDGVTVRDRRIADETNGAYRERRAIIEEVHRRHSEIGAEAANGLVNWITRRG